MLIQLMQISNKAEYASKMYVVDRFRGSKLLEIWFYILDRKIKFSVPALNL